MNVNHRPYMAETARADLKSTQRAWRAATDVLQHATRGAKNAVLTPAILFAKMRGKESKYEYVRSNCARRHEIRTEAALERMREHSLTHSAAVVLDVKNHPEAAFNTPELSHEEVRQILLEMDPANADACKRLDLVDTSSLYEAMPNEDRLGDVASLTYRGCKLHADYMRRNFGTDIRFHEPPRGFENLDPQTQYRQMAESLPAVLKDLRRTAHDMRCTILLGADHLVPVIYMREGGAEGLLVADSLGSQAPGGHLAALVAAECGKRDELRDLPIYSTNDARLCSSRLSATDALNVGRIATERQRSPTGHDGRPAQPNLLREIQADRGVLCDGVYPALLPPEFLLGTETTEFVDRQANGRSSGSAGGNAPLMSQPLRNDSQGRTLRRALKDTSEPTAAGVQPNHLHALSRAQAADVQVEFYNSQLTYLLGDDWGEVQQRDFDVGMKQGMLRQQLRADWNAAGPRTP